MKLKIRYTTKERRWISASTFQNISKDAELEPVRIIRTPCGRDAAANRYYYDAIFSAPDDAERIVVVNGKIRVNINRKYNPQFNPKKLKWEGNIVNCDRGELT